MGTASARPVLASGLLAAGIILAASAPAEAQSRDVTNLMNRIQQLEQQVRALEGRAGGGGGPAAARLEVRQSQHEEDLRALTGRVEELGYQVSRLSERVDKLAADMEYRLAQGAQGAQAAPAGEAPGASQPAMPPPGPAAAPAPEAAPPPAPGEIYPERQPRPLGTMPAGEAGAAPSAPPPAAAPGPVPPAAGTPRQQYAQAYDLLRQGKYDQAEVAFSTFLAQHPQDPLTENARYWLGETFYARGNYARAAEVFVEGYQTSKTGPKAPDTLLKLGMSLSSMGKKKEACATFKEMSRAFPEAPAAVKEKATQEGRRAGCS